MKFKVKSVKWNKVEADALVMFVSSDRWVSEIALLDKSYSGNLKKDLELDKFEAKLGKLIAYPTFGQLPAKSVVLVGVGESEKLDPAKLRQAAGHLARYLKNSHKQTVALDLSLPLLAKIAPEQEAQVVVEGLALGAYKFNKYKSEDKTKPRAEIEVWLLVNPARIQHAVNGVKVAELMVGATCFARDLVNESPTVTTPTYLANVARNLGKHGEITVEVLDASEAKKLGMNAYLAVARGSAEAPKFIKLTYKGGKKKVVLAGKAITFDTGGLSLKDAKNMETMKMDMAGAAAVLGVFKVLPSLKPKVTVIGLIAATENMPGSKASKPGDVVIALNGKSIEILNTDAEGRLTLADVLAYGVLEKPDLMIDLATLTGACMVALGEDIAGLFTNNEELKKQLLTASWETGEKIWDLPLEKDYRELIKSDIADLRNIAKNRYGGAITAALFLEEFVGLVPWAHLDIAGPAFAEKDGPLTPKGATGFGVMTLLALLQKL
ncbi:MAG: putative cytosol aminopeptidase [Candidatus Gottesmanbacteria bacterium GW2011_GWB1_43_11]|uniref:Probable cytosol aminopeptidase n=1 Tax=Candidatus Gottesmanbacteria bacterium GW2011_GWB1_43_11 TaxID=1618446 RepID=A0A0G1CLP4_9BACT|nr:MAG: putative cytosol aminopeptidase [Candidatus Gottesmanbacteria bacterium GW2011_GWA2_42_16]KKS54960.1 MAG: putative cytosol aminopeptidase [Candidatus Gottesmanbacteria bacterium GW2011_GWA1_42_26]KKS80455.1 MAG: leucyl aminopeptidase, leucyl aminopeptidase [Candidatus Gottesmanbacteria bacterium GW2011_GWC1_43_10]KKS86665.1 MAG: putative cytosol aminopeptidase [Candidatus Gottesmanbacteria bacterium GW2011_GWB1_43_11]OGG27602.1 MAG: hypothetical protein A3A59_03420 [Candidatus Gottesman